MDIICKRLTDCATAVQEVEEKNCNIHDHQNMRECIEEYAEVQCTR